MRIIGGEFRSRPIQAPEGEETRPTPERLREALFNILQLRIEGTIFVDAHAGSGAVGIEALSRGARRVILIERSKPTIAVIKQNLHSLKITDRAKVIQGSATTYLAGQTADIVFLDPPYDRVKEYEACFRALGDKPPSIVIAQHAAREKLADAYGSFERTRTVRQGDNSLSFYSPVGTETQDAITPTDGVTEQAGEPDGGTEPVA
jgi:16S rRNA (guanine966-N2)-methyltransferase